MVKTRVEKCVWCECTINSKDYPDKTNSHPINPNHPCLKRLESYAGLYEIALIMICRSDNVNDIWKIAKSALMSVVIARMNDEPLDGKNEEKSEKEKDSKPGG